MHVEMEMSMGCPNGKNGSCSHHNCLGFDRETNLKDKAGDKAVRAVKISQEEGRE